MNNIEVNSFVFTNRTGVGSVVELGENIIIKTLNGRNDRIRKDDTGFLFLKDFDPELAVPLKLQSTEELYDRMKELSGRKRGRKKGKNKSDVLVERLVADTLKDLGL